MTHLLVIFGAGFLSVFAAGFQSRNVNHGNYVWAAVGAMGIALSSAQVWNLVTDAHAGLLESFVYGLSGICGITSSMWVHQRFIKKPERRHSARPSCFGSNPGPQAQAEHDCRLCPVAHLCLPGGTSI